MRTIGLVLGVCFVSLSCYANSHPTLTTSLKNATQHTASAQQSSPFIYGGQDISQPTLATANEALWKGGDVGVG